MATKKKIPRDEVRIHLDLWFQNGSGMWLHGQGKHLPEVSIGRTDSELGLGFLVLDPKTKKIRAEFVLDRPQIENLHAYLGRQIRRLKKTEWTTSGYWSARRSS
jgi:hypothetical protein